MEGKEGAIGFLPRLFDPLFFAKVVKFDPDSEEVRRSLSYLFNAKEEIKLDMISKTASL